MTTIQASIAAVLHNDILPPRPKRLSRLSLRISHTISRRHRVDSTSHTSSEIIPEALPPPLNAASSNPALHHEARAPIDSLTPELLEKILLLASIDYSVFNSYQGPWAYSQVCRFWRLICVSSPRMWSCITIKPLYHLTSHTRGLLRRALYLSVGAPAGLSITLWCPRMTECQFDKAATVEEILRLMWPAADRWRSLRMYVPVQTRLSRCLRGVAGGVPILERVSISMHGPKNVAGDGKVTINAFQYAPSLTSLTLSGLHPHTEVLFPPDIPNYSDKRLPE
ncbi:hypothetical protein CYLTODRAFT_419510 [Cylindrobasidium torrendii FP15055 ss-10]|uniref:F-box domain-containing protein n=1 Tax=Cylindrobasidium torrendii FP15055 ss-10 TaxID=1314674 RepID=A0A0D7BJI4_9AGAR|nr:hypothetical protein CYLTODRAFT_419510 [Cylindrobasidium torrendii FP15055 ss-10]